MSEPEEEGRLAKGSAPIRQALDAANLAMGPGNGAANLAMGHANAAGAATDCVSQACPKEVSTDSVSQPRPKEVSSSAQARRKEKVQVGDLAPGFTLLNQAGTPVNLGDFLGKQPLVLYFYPRDNTSVCTEEACAFRDSYEVFKGGGAEIMGISSDSVESHQRFAKEHQLPFILLSDEEGTIRKRYGVPTAFGLPGRVTYIIDRQGIVRRMFFSQYTSKKHVDVALETLQSIREEHV